MRKYPKWRKRNLATMFRFFNIQNYFQLEKRSFQSPHLISPNYKSLSKDAGLRFLYSVKDWKIRADITYLHSFSPSKFRILTSMRTRWWYIFWNNTSAISIVFAASLTKPNLSTAALIPTHVASSLQVHKSI